MLHPRKAHRPAGRPDKNTKGSGRSIIKAVSSKLVPLSIALCLIAAAPAQQARAQTVSNETVHAVLDQGRLRLSWDAADGKLQKAITPTGIWQMVTAAVSPYRHRPLRPKTFTAWSCRRLGRSGSP